jgi:hypothetical protein
MKAVNKKSVPFHAQLLSAKITEFPSNCRLESLDTKFELYVHLICQINDNNHLYIVIYLMPQRASLPAASERGFDLCAFVEQTSKLNTNINRRYSYS